MNSGNNLSASVTPNDERYKSLMFEFAELISKKDANAILSVSITVNSELKPVLVVSDGDRVFVVELSSIGEYRMVKSNSILGFELQPVIK